MALTLTNRGAGWTSQFLASTTATSPLFGDMWTRGLDLNLLNPNDYLLLGKVCSERVVQAGNLEKARSPKLLLMGELFHINEPISAAEIAAIAGKFRTLVQTMQAGQGVPAAERVAENASLAVCKTAFLVAAEEVHTRTLGSLSAFVTSLVAYTKKGNISDNLVTRLTDNIKDSTQKTVVIDAELVRVFYNQYARGLNETTAHQLFTAIQQILPTNCQAIVNLVTRTSNTGMTAALTVQEAMQEHPNFPWRSLADLFPSEIVTVETAIRAVDNNPYIGFKTSLGEIDSTKYKNVAWVAKELLIRLNGKNSLKMYKGWTRLPANAPKLEAMLNAYIVAASEAEVPENAPARDAVARILELR